MISSDAVPDGDSTDNKGRKRQGNSSLPDFPDVSLLSSWTTAPPYPLSLIQSVVAPLGLTLALQEGISLYDLYFLNHRDIPWYTHCIRKKKGKMEQEPHRFAAGLTKTELETIAEHLQKLMTEHYGGKLVGRRPRFAAVATFFPSISDIDDNKRNEAVKAIRNTLCLAGNLGIAHVEIVAGAGVPGLDYEEDDTPDDYRAKRMAQLVRSIKEIYTFSPEDNSEKQGDICIALNSLDKDGRLPYLAMEIELGPSFLINRLPEFKKLRDLLRRHPLAYDKLCLNVDVAHAFLTGYDVSSLDADLKKSIAHIHISDHGGDARNGGMHAADLRPGRFHFFDYPSPPKSAKTSGEVLRVDYQSWLKLAIELRRNRSTYSRYSGSIAIELEACHDINEVLSAIQLTRQWLRECGQTQQGKAVSSPIKPEGALLVIDLGNSTQEFAKTPEQLDNLVQALCKIVLAHGGSVMSYTGDGFIALFEKNHFKDDATAARNALDAALQVCRYVQEFLENDITIRAALHWGEAIYIPTSGPLRDQIMGAAVICTARLCDWLGHVVEPAEWKDERKTLIGVTQTFFQQVEDHAIEGHKWRYWGDKDFKGLSEPSDIYRLIKAG